MFLWSLAAEEVEPVQPGQTLCHERFKYLPSGVTKLVFQNKTIPAIAPGFCLAPVAFKLIELMTGTGMPGRSASMVDAFGIDSICLSVSVQSPAREPFSLDKVLGRGEASPRVRAADYSSIGNSSPQGR